MRHIGPGRHNGRTGIHFDRMFTSRVTILTRRWLRAIRLNGRLVGHFFVDILQDDGPNTMRTIIRHQVGLLIRHIGLATRQHQVRIRIVTNRVVGHTIRRTSSFHQFVISSTVLLLIPRRQRHRTPNMINDINNMTLIRRIGIVRFITNQTGILIRNPTIFRRRPASRQRVSRTFRTFRFTRSRHTIHPQTNRKGVRIVTPNFNHRATSANQT